jgi:diguanylate cyclase (GGDEF)-like protein
MLQQDPRRARAATWLFGLVIPLVLIAVILTADVIESPKTAYVGVLAVVPMLAAVFATPRITAVVASITWLSAFAFGHLASDGNVPAQTVRLVIIALAGVAAVGAAVLRRRRERALVRAQQAATVGAELRKQAVTDQLTGLANRHGVADRVDAAEPDIARTVALVDCDNLKTVNDRYGHVAGDEYLQAIAGRLAGSLSRTDLIARWGGDEFIIVQRLTVSEALPTLHRAHAAIASSPISADGHCVEATVSVGVSSWEPGMSFDAALSSADAALYEAKEGGRNRVVVSDGSAPTMRG